MGEGLIADVGRRAEEGQVQGLFNGRPFLGVRVQKGEDALLGRVAHVAPGGGVRGGGVVEDGGEDLVVRLAGEGRAAAEQDPQHHARAPHVAERQQQGVRVEGGGKGGEGGGNGGDGGRGREKESGRGWKGGRRMMCVPFVGVESMSDDLRGHVARRAYTTHREDTTQGRAHESRGRGA